MAGAGRRFFPVFVPGPRPRTECTAHPVRRTGKVGRPLRGRPALGSVSRSTAAHGVHGPPMSIVTSFRLPLPSRCAPAAVTARLRRCVCPASGTCRERSSPQPLRRRNISVHQRLNLRVRGIDFILLGLDFCPAPRLRGSACNCPNISSEETKRTISVYQWLDLPWPAFGRVL